MGSGSTGTYTSSDKTLQQRQVNAHTRQFQGFMRTLHAKLRLHVDDVARLQEIANLLKPALEWEQVRELYWDEYQADVGAGGGTGGRRRCAGGEAGRGRAHQGPCPRGIAGRPTTIPHAAQLLSLESNPAERSQR